MVKTKFILFLLILISFSLVSAADYKFQNTSGTDLVTIEGTSGNVTSTGWFKGLFNWIVGSTKYTTFNGTQLEFNETQLNLTIDSRAGGLGTFAPVSEPLWSSNFTAYNSSWSSTYNSTYNTWAYNQTTAATTLLNGTGLVKNWDPNTYIKDWNSTGYIKNWDPSSYIKDWNSTGYIKNWALTLASDNSSWNQTYANTLYAGIAWNYNQTTAAVNILNGTGLVKNWDPNTYIKDWNSTGYIKNWDPSSYIKDWNSTGYIKNWALTLASDNSSWNQTYANTLYAGIAWNYNQTTAAVNILNGTGLVKNWDPNTYIKDWNSTGYIKNWDPSSYIKDWNSTGYIKNWALTLASDNSSWNQTYANTLYAGIAWNYNQTTAAVNILNGTGLVKNWDPNTYIKDWNSTGYIKNWDPSSYIKDWNSTGYIKNWALTLASDNSSWNQTYANTLYAGIAWNYNQTTAAVNILNGTGLVKNWDPNTYIKDWNSTGYIKNWDPSSYIKDWNSTGYIKNWALTLASDNSSWNQTYANTLYAGIAWNYNQTTAAVNILNGTGLVKNWDPNTYIKDWNSTGYIKNWDPSSYIKDWNSTGYIKNWALTLASDNSSWNQTYANTLYAGIAWNYNQTTAAVNILNGTGLVKNWDPNTYIKDWNSTGYIKNWNATGYIKDWSYLTSGAGTVTGSGTSGYLSMWNGTGSQNNSVIFQNGTNVGIGTTAPIAKLNIENQAAGINKLGLFEYHLGIGDGGSLDFGASDITYGKIESVIDASGEVSLRFYDYDNSILREIMRLDGGNVGIGTTAPTKKFEVNGSVGALNIDVANTMPTINTTTNNVTITSQGGSVIIRLG